MTPLFERRLREMLKDLADPNGATYTADVINAIKGEEPPTYVSKATRQWAEDAQRQMPEPVIPQKMATVFLVTQTAQNGTILFWKKGKQGMPETWWNLNPQRAAHFPSREMAKQRVAKINYGRTSIVTLAQAWELAQ